MKGRMIRTLLLCAALLLAVGIAPISSHTAAPHRAPYVARQSPESDDGARVDDTETLSPEPESHYVYLPHVMRSNYVFLQSWGNEIGLFEEPTGIAVSRDRVYVADAGNHRIQVFDLYGTPQKTFGGIGGGGGEFYNPQYVALDGSGNVYVTQWGNDWDRIQKFAADGTFLTKFSCEMWSMPSGIAVDGSGNVYVAFGNRHQIWKFASDGTYLLKWGSPGSEEGQFSYPHGIAVDGDGNVYVADTDNHRIQKFTADGAFRAKWGGEGSGDGQFDNPRGIAVDGSGNVYVADTDNHRIQKFTANGGFLAKWGSGGSGNGQFDYPVGIAVYWDSAKEIWTVYVADTANARIQKFTANGDFLAKWGSGGSGDGQFDYPVGIAADGSGDVYVADGGNNRIQKFTADMAFLLQWGSEGSGMGQFSYPQGIAVDRRGNVYVADTGNYRIQKFTANGTFLDQWGSYGSGEGQFSVPRDIAVDGSGNVYVTDTDNHRVQKFTSEGDFLLQWYGDLYQPYGIAVDRSGKVYVADSGNHRIQKFTADGTFLTEWRGYNIPSYSGWPSGIAVDESGDIYAVEGLLCHMWVDMCYHRVQKYTSDGNFMTEWGTFGGGAGQFHSPSSIAVDERGNVFVVDTVNDRIQKFAPHYPTPDPVHGLALNGSFEETPDLVRWTYGGELPVGLVNEAFDGAKAAQLGEPTEAITHEQGMAWLRQTMYIRPEWERPVLTFRYRMFVNDIIHYSDFHVWLTRSNGAWLAEIKRDGFRSCNEPPTAPPPGYDLGWRTGTYDLSAFKGQTVRVVFENRNLHGGYSYGIWTYVDDVRVVDAGLVVVPYSTYLPLVASGGPSCDPVVGGLRIESLTRPVRP